MLNGMKVLTVDDDADARALLDQILRQAGAVVAMAESVDEAIGYLARGFNPHVLLTDLHMPGADGFAMIEQMRRYYSDIPVLVVTAYYDEPGVADRLASAGATLLRKPIDPRTLVRAVAEAFNHSR